MSAFVRDWRGFSALASAGDGPLSGNRSTPTLHCSASARGYPSMTSSQATPAASQTARRQSTLKSSRSLAGFAIAASTAQPIALRTDRWSGRHGSSARELEQQAHRKTRGCCAIAPKRALGFTSSFAAIAAISLSETVM